MARIHTRPAARDAGGFTLVELLVVLGVITILLALLLPALNMARAASRRTQCQSQLHQIGLALDQYLESQGSRGRFPFAAMMPTVTPQRPGLPRVLDGFIEHNTAVFGCPDDSTYFATERISYEYPLRRLAGKTREQVRKRRNGALRPSAEVVLLYDYDPVHGDRGAVGSRNGLYLDGHVDGY